MRCENSTKLLYFALFLALEVSLSSCQGSSSKPEKKTQNTTPAVQGTLSGLGGASNPFAQPTPIPTFTPFPTSIPPTQTTVDPFLLLLQQFPTLLSGLLNTNSAGRVGTSPGNTGINTGNKTPGSGNISGGNKTPGGAGTVPPTSSSNPGLRGTQPGGSQLGGSNPGGASLGGGAGFPGRPTGSTGANRTGGNSRGGNNSQTQTGNPNGSMNPDGNKTSDGSIGTQPPGMGNPNSATSGNSNTTTTINTNGGSAGTAQSPNGMTQSPDPQITASETSMERSGSPITLDATQDNSAIFDDMNYIPKDLESHPMNPENQFEPEYLPSTTSPESEAYTYE